MLNPIEKPTADELRAAEILSQSFDAERRVIRAVVRRPKPPTTERGHCVRPDFVFEMHIPTDGSVATFWQVYEANPSFSL